MIHALTDIFHWNKQIKTKKITKLNIKKPKKTFIIILIIIVIIVIIIIIVNNIIITVITLY